MRDDDLDRILSSQQEIIPSSGFVDAVMDAVRRESEAPPMPFPWKRALPGLFAACFTLVSVLVAAITPFTRGTPTRVLPTGLLSALDLILQAWQTIGGNWIALALIVSLASVKLSMRFVSGQVGW
jgi:hypothetical protein